mmetsp:Transcript_36031/g.78615  ORF Transcript_36031/g.78615 Transcript_36031/m.78615 type:complete len:222 (+) Transcript_36031:260-925(+)
MVVGPVCVRPPHRVRGDPPHRPQEGLARAAVPLLGPLARQHVEGGEALEDAEDVVAAGADHDLPVLLPHPQRLQHPRQPRVAHHPVGAHHGRRRAPLGEVAPEDARPRPAPDGARAGGGPGLVDDARHRHPVHRHPEQVGHREQVARHELARAVQRVDVHDHALRLHLAQLRRPRRRHHLRRPGPAERVALHRLHHQALLGSAHAVLPDGNAAHTLLRHVA